jgi:hypothetical protein
VGEVQATAEEVIDSIAVGDHVAKMHELLELWRAAVVEVTGEALTEATEAIGRHRRVQELLGAEPGSHAHRERERDAKVGSRPKFDVIAGG